MNQPKENILLRMRPYQRIGVSLIFSVIAFFLTSNCGLSPLVRTMLLWDVFCLFYVAACWIVVVKRPVEGIRRIARIEDGSRVFVLSIIVLASLASMLTVLLIVLSKNNTNQPLYLPVAIAGILLSWILVHTTFTFHYAYMYYDDDTNDATKHAGGLEFPNEKKPDYLDFAYFSFVIGMTFQVSDVEISARKIRRFALFHGLISFALNTFVVALTVNLIAGLKS